MLPEAAARCPSTDPERLFKLRVAVARHGEGDRARWWNTNKALSTTGALALRRNLPRTYPFAQARIVFAVAERRCKERYDPPDAVTLWDMPEAFEEAISEAWGRWLDDAEAWAHFFDVVRRHATGTLTDLLSGLGLVSEAEVAEARSLRRAAEGRSVPIPRRFTGTPSDVSLLALGFARGDEGLAVPYARIDDP
jgi:hypothetical protein